MHNENTNIVSLPIWNLQVLKARITKINRRCERFGWPLVDAGFGEPYETFYQNPDTAVKTYYKRVDVTISTPPVGFDGWRFIATLENVNGKNIMSAVPGETVPAEYRTASSKCDHCKADRHRTYTYVLTHEDGTYMQVGSTCINDFLSGHDALSYAKIQDSIAALFAMGGNVDPDELLTGEGGPRVSSGIDVLSYMSAVATVIREDGWMSRTRASELVMFGHSTADTANNVLDPKWLKLIQQREPGKYDHDPADHAKAVEVVEWLRSEHFDPDVRRLSDYEWNLSVCIGDDFITWKNIGLAASAFACYDRFRGIQAEIKRSKQNSEYVGEPKQRLTMQVHIDLVRQFEGYYGPSTLYVMRNSDGNKLITFYSGHVFDPAEDDVVDIKATVKKHELDKNGVKQTVVTRITEVK